MLRWPSTKITGTVDNWVDYPEYCPPWRLDRCGPAKVLNKVQARYGDRVAVLSVVVPHDTVESAQKYMTDHGVTNPVLIDCGAVALSYLRPPMHAPTIHVPHVFLIDRQGVIRSDFHHEEGTSPIFNGDGLFAEIDKLLVPVRKPAAPKKK